MKAENLRVKPEILRATTGLAEPASVLKGGAVALPGARALCSFARGNRGRGPEVRMCLSNNSMEILVACLDVEPQVTRSLVALLNDGERDRASRFVFERDRFRFTVGRARLRQLLSARLGVRPESVELVYGRHGKPALATFYANLDLRFNVSHSEDVAVYALSYGREIGVDVEAVRAIPDAEEIAARFFSHRENDEYRALDPRDRPLGFFNCWTRKEALIKAIGDGLCYPLDHFDVSLAPGEPEKILRIGDTQGDECGWSLESFSPAPGFVAAVVAENVSRRAIESRGPFQSAGMTVRRYF